MADGITKGEMRDLLIEQAKLLKGGNSSSFGGTSSGGTSGGGASAPTFGATGISSYDERLGKSGTAVEKLAATFEVAKDKADDLAKMVGNNLDVWRDLSKTGANFGNDMVAMKAAQMGSRVSMEEFTDTIKKNNTAFIGLGGNVSKGAENFAKLTNEMYTNYAPVTDSLRQQGITNKELNDTLALQIGMQRGTFKDTKEGHEESIKAATDLAEQMNKTAILTGKSRQQQEEALKEASVNQMVEGKMRLIGATQGPEAEAKARKEFLIQQQQADARGQGQYFKEVFAAGHAITQGAAMQQATLGKQAIATAEQARATARGDSEAANKFNQQAREEQLANTKNVAMAQAAIYSEGNSAYAKQAAENNKANQSIYDARLKLEQDENFRKLSTADQLKLIDKQVAEDAKAKKASGEESAGSQSTKAAVQVEQRMRDAGTAVMDNLVVPLNQKAGPAIKEFADAAAGSTQKLSSGRVVTTPQANNLAVKQGMEGTAGTAKERAVGIENGILSTLGTVGSLGEKAASAAKGAVDFVGNAKSSKPDPVKMAEGGVVEPKPGGTSAIIGEGGKTEAVIPLDKLDGMIKSKEGGINIAEISKTISTTISSAQGSSASPMSKNEKFQTADWADATQAEIAEGLEGSKKQLAMWTKDAQAAEQRIAEIKAEGSKRELDTGEQFELATLEKEKTKNQRALDYHQSTINVLSNLDEYKARLETESKEKTVTATEAAVKISEELGIKQVEIAKAAAEEQTTAAKIAEELGIKQVEIAKTSSEDQKTVLTDRQKVVLQYAYTDTEGKQVQLENAKSIVAAETRIIAEKNKEKEALETETAGRELTVREKSRLERIQAEIDNRTESLALRKDELEVYANLDKLKAENEVKVKEEVSTKISEIATTAGTAEVLTKEEATAKIDQLIKETENMSVEEKDKAKAEIAKLSDVANGDKSLAKVTTVKPPSLEEMKAQFAKMSTDISADPAKLKDMKAQIDAKKESFFPDFGGLGGKDGDKGIPSFLASLNSQISKAEIKKPEEKKTTAGTTAQAVKKEEPKKVETTAKKDEKPSGKVEQVGLKDLHTSLEHLNKSMAKLISYSEQTATAAQAQIKATKSLSGNKFA